jgi:hypothetical protein
MIEQPQSGGSSQRSTPNEDKAPCKLGRDVCDFIFYFHSVVGIVTRLWVGQVQGTSLSPIMFRPSSGAHPAFCLMGIGALMKGLKLGVCTCVSHIGNKSASSLVLLFHIACN